MSIRIIRAFYVLALLALVNSTVELLGSGGCMGGDCGSGAAKTPMYPSLMTLPALTPVLLEAQHRPR